MTPNRYYILGKSSVTSVRFDRILHAKCGIKLIEIIYSYTQSYLLLTLLLYKIVI